MTKPEADCMFRSRKTTASVPDAAPTPAPLPVEAIAHAGVFLGTLRSEVDEPDLLAEPFERLAVVAEGVIGAYRRRALSERDAAERLQLLRLKSSENVEWTLGPTSMRWYRRLPGGIWKPAVPPSQADEALAESADRAVEAVASMAAPVEVDQAARAAAEMPPRADAAAAGSEPVSVLPGAVVVALSPVVDVPEALPGGTPVPAPVTVSPSPGDFGVEEVLDPEDPTVRDWSFSEDESEEEGTEGGGLQVFSSEPTAARRTIPTLQVVPVAEPSDGGYGYGEYEDPAPEFAPDFIPASADDAPTPAPAAAGNAPVQSADQIGDPTATVPGDAIAAPAEDEELRAMLAALAQDTGISLTGFDQPQS